MTLLRVSLTVRGLRCGCYFLSPLASVFPLFSDEYDDDDEPAPTKNTYYTLL